MIEFDPEDLSVTIEEIDDFMYRYDTHNIFSSRKQFRKNFYLHFIRLISEGHVMTFRDIETDKLTGLCSWLFCTQESKKDINKIKWLIPKDIDQGQILYIDTCLSGRSDIIPEIRKNLLSRFKSRIKEVFWFNMPKGRVFRTKLKGGNSCQTAV